MQGMVAKGGVNIYQYSAILADMAYPSLANEVWRDSAEPSAPSQPAAIAAPRVPALIADVSDALSDQNALKKFPFQS